MYLASGTERLLHNILPSARESSAWQTVALPAGTDSYSAVVWKDVVWFLASNQLYQLNPGDNTYSLVANAPSLTQLVAATDESNGGQKTILYARNADNRFVRLENETWTEDEEETLAHLLPASVCLLPACRCHIIRLWSVPS